LDAANNESCARFQAKHFKKSRSTDAVVQAESLGVLA
jgi:hypothetical protein